MTADTNTDKEGKTNRGLRALREVRVQDIKAGQVIQQVGRHGKAGSRGGVFTQLKQAVSNCSRKATKHDLIEA